MKECGRKVEAMNKIDLNGTWKLSKADDSEFIDVKIPGSVLSGLLENNQINDPFDRMNEYKTRDLFWNDYEFARFFTVDTKTLKEDQIVLVCEGLDTLAEISVNGRLIAITSNMHRIWRFPVKEYLVDGSNEIHIIFRSVLQYNRDYQTDANKIPQFVACGAMKGNELIRKAHSMFGWDWGPQLPDAGIYRNIYLEAYSEIKIKEIRIHQEHDNGIKVRIGVLLEGEASEKYKIRAVITEVGVAEEGCCEESGVDEHKTEFNFEIKEPKLWWPNGYGEQNLYCVKVQVKDGDGNILQEEKKNIGLRTLTISQMSDQWGKEFAFIVNGIRIFARGGNYIPEDCVYSRITEEKQEYLLESCKRANFNCIRIWGGGYYPTDAFYDICDKKGLIIWQDLMFACNVYDVTDEFAKNCEAEILDNVRRLRHHACLGVWCGNNEIESAWDHWPDFQKESMYLRADYIKLFEMVLPKAVREADGDTFYWPSSPSSGGSFDSPDDENRGDAHYWDVWHGMKPFTDYRNHYFRFCSEFGFQSFPSMKTVRTFTRETDRNIFSRVMESHQKTIRQMERCCFICLKILNIQRIFSICFIAVRSFRGWLLKVAWTIGGGTGGGAWGHFTGRSMITGRLRLGQALIILEGGRPCIIWQKSFSLPYLQVWFSMMERWLCIWPAKVKKRRVTRLVCILKIWIVKLLNIQSKKEVLIRLVQKQF